MAGLCWRWHSPRLALLSLLMSRVIFFLATRPHRYDRVMNVVHTLFLLRISLEYTTSSTQQYSSSDQSFPKGVTTQAWPYEWGKSTQAAERVGKIGHQIGLCCKAVLSLL